MNDLNVYGAGKIADKGFLDVDVDPTLDLFHEIEVLKKEEKCNCFSSLLPGT